MPPGSYHYVATFAGFVPAERPELSIIVVIDEPTGDIYGGTVAAPVFAELASTPCATTGSRRRRRAGPAPDTCRGRPSRRPPPPRRRRGKVRATVTTATTTPADIEHHSDHRAVDTR